jgi:hypothetical protein
MIDPPLSAPADTAFCLRARRLHQYATGLTNEHEAEVAQTKLKEHLARRGCTLDDLPEIFAWLDNPQGIDPATGLPPDPREDLWKQSARSDG